MKRWLETMTLLADSRGFYNDISLQIMVVVSIREMIGGDGWEEGA